MGCYFLNTLLPKANPAEVCEAICRWHAQEGYIQQFGRRPFDCDTIFGDSVVYVLSNTLYGANIAAFAGQGETLTITALAGPNQPDYFDSFDFSTTAITPEPSPFFLTGIAG